MYCKSVENKTEKKWYKVFYQSNGSTKHQSNAFYNTKSNDEKMNMKNILLHEKKTCCSTKQCYLSYVNSVNILVSSVRFAF